MYVENLTDQNIGTGFLNNLPETTSNRLGIVDSLSKELGKHVFELQSSKLFMEIIKPFPTQNTHLLQGNTE